MQLRPYQTAILSEIRASYKSGFRAPLVVSPTGSGKSALIAYMMANTKKRTLILAHRIEIVQQISAALTIKHGIVAPGYPRSASSIQVGTMQTVSRRLGMLPRFDWVISDEAHISACPTWANILTHYSGAWGLGLSASPTRLDGRGLNQHFDTLVKGPSIGGLIALGFLCPLRTFAPAVEIDKLKIACGEFVMSDAAMKLDKPVITGSAVDHYRRLAPGRRAIVFCCSRAHADHVAAQFRAAGYSSINVDGSMTTDERRSRIRDFRQGRIEILTNVELLTTGFDCPEIEVGIMLRPTNSLALFIQQAGRIVRPSPGKKDAILLDHVGNVARFGMVEDEREWTLDGHGKRNSSGASGPAVRLCPRCFAATRPGPPTCAHCGHVFESAPRQVEETGGELTEVDPEVMRRNRRKEQGSANSLEALIELGVARQYKSPKKWADYVWKARQRMGKS